MTTKQTILPMLAIIASIAIMTLPTALADEVDRLTTPELLTMIEDAEISIDNLSTSKHQLLADIDQITAAMNAHAFRIAELDAIVADSGVLTEEQLEGYAQHEAAIVQNQTDIDNKNAKIDRHNANIVLHQDAIANIYSIIDSRTT